MRLFYDAMLPRLAENSRALLLFARYQDRDVGYIHGGQAEKLFRSFQFSYDHDLAELSIGNLLHLDLIRWLTERSVEIYDLGMHMDYKASWGELRLVTPNLFYFPRQAFSRLEHLAKAVK